MSEYIFPIAHSETTLFFLNHAMRRPFPSNHLVYSNLVQEICELKSLFARWDGSPEGLCLQSSPESNAKDIIQRRAFAYYLNYLPRRRCESARYNLVAIVCSEDYWQPDAKYTVILKKKDRSHSDCDCDAEIHLKHVSAPGNFSFFSLMTHCILFRIFMLKQLFRLTVLSNFCPIKDLSLIGPLNVVFMLDTDISASCTFMWLGCLFQGKSVRISYLTLQDKVISTATTTNSQCQELFALDEAYAMANQSLFSDFRKINFDVFCIILFYLVRIPCSWLYFLYTNWLRQAFLVDLWIHGENNHGDSLCFYLHHQLEEMDVHEKKLHESKPGASNWKFWAKSISGSMKAMSTRDELLAESPLDIISAMSESEVCSFMPPSKLLIWYGDEKAGGEEREEKRSAAVSPITAMDP